MSNEIKVAQQRQITEDVTIRHREIQVGLHVFSRETRRSVVVDGHLKAPGLTAQVDQGMVDDENLRDLLAGETFYTCGEAFKIMPKRIRDEIALRGVRHWERTGDPADLLNPGDGVYDALEAGDWSLEDLVRIGALGGERVLLNSTGHPLASGVRGSSDGGFFDDRLYDIDKLREILQHRSDMVFFDCYGNNYGAEPAAWLMPDGDGLFVNFIWQAKADDLMRIYESAQDMMDDDRPDPTFWEVVFETDALGLRAAGCAKRDTFFAGEERRRAAPGLR